MEKREFEKILDEELSKIEEKLTNREFGVPIIRKIKNSYQMSVRDRFTYFFKEIGLEIGDVENRTIDARNASAHGSAKWDDDSFEKLIQDTRAYQTLLNRVVLKLLEYGGYYIDRSTYKDSQRQIDVPLGGKVIK